MRVLGDNAPDAGDFGRHLDQERRKQVFRRSHRPGEEATGRLLEWVEPGLAWVAIDGQPLLVPLTASPPQAGHPDSFPPGTRLRFLIQALEPDIQLTLLPAEAPRQGRLHVTI